VKRDPLPPIERRAMTLATVALHAAMAGDWDKATDAVQRISDECGAVGIGRAILGWSDTMIARLVTGHIPGQPIRLAFQQVETGRIDTDADKVPAEVRWAGRVIAARAANDHATWDALMDALPDDGQAIGAHVAKVLEMSVLACGGKQAGR
jgi:hypothetical protein